MIIQLLNLLLLSMGFGYNDRPVPKNSLHRKPEYTILPWKVNPVVFAVLMLVGMILFGVFVFLFVPGTESGLVYNGSFS